MGSASSNFVSESIYDYFDLGELIGTGNFGHVLTCFPIGESSPIKQDLAVKIVDLESSQSKATEEVKAARDELRIMRGLQHPHIVKLVQTFEDKRFLYVVMERLLGGELFEALKSKTAEILEQDVARLGSQLMQALAYIHGLLIVHRDVKAQNILLTEPPELSGRALGRADIKLIDFGLAAKLRQDCCGWSQTDRQLEIVCGTPAMCAPEIWATQPKANPKWALRYGANYGPKVDVYAAGVVLYLAIYGQLPYVAASTSKLVEKVCSPTTQPPFLPGVRSKDFKVSSASQDCLTSMLAKHPDERISAAGAASSTWLSGGSLGRRTRRLPSASFALPLEVRMSAAREAQDALALQSPDWQLPDFSLLPSTKQEQQERMIALMQAKSLYLQERDDDTSSDEGSDTCGW
eukprot:TRINITY_DN61246_c0_g1_i1.p1 TRINITY_DN61246_c0_g1~~TRINITY_DN61246_c0_g1_i1.p1  ORF type:complete len:406 (-),score=91.83 TRINITY_DN61246_c0_g1_i1:31-1248(-)